MHKSNKAQVSDTISWVVATIIILIILSIPISLINLGKISFNCVYFDRGEDPITAKSISGYLLKDYEMKLKPALGKQPIVFSPEDEKSIASFLDSLRRYDAESWGAIISSEGKEIYSKSPPKVAGFTHKSWEIVYPVNSFGKEIIFTFERGGQAV